LLLFHSPAGWDNEKKMAILHENMATVKPEDFYNDVIQKPITARKVSPLKVLPLFPFLKYHTDMTLKDLF